MRKKVWAIGSGKGGVGKTFICSSLGITLSKLGYSVILVDLDTTGANIHSTLGIEPSHKNLRSWISGESTLQELVTPTPFPHLSYVQGFWDTWSPIQMTSDQMKSIASELKTLRADYIIVDLGPGASEQNLALFESADEKFLITSPEPTSIEKTYRYLEAFMCKTIRDNSTAAAFDDLSKTLYEFRQRKLKAPFSFRSYIKNHDGFQFDHFDSFSKNPVRLLINSSRSQANEELGHSIKSVANKYYDLRLDYAGAIEYDNAVWQSVKNREPVLIAQPFAPISGQILAICKQLIDHSDLRAVV